MGYFNYFVKCVIRKLVNFIFNKKNFFKFCCILFFVFCITKLFLQTPISYGATTTITDTTYYDGYLANIELWDSLQSDLLSRLLYSYENGSDEVKNQMKEFIDKFTSGYFVSLCYYGNGTGSDYVGQLSFDKKIINVFLIPRDSLYSLGVQYRQWANNGEVPVNQLNSSSEYYQCFFVGNDLTFQTLQPGTSHFMPTYLIDYRSSDLVTFFINFYNDFNSADIESIISNSTNTIVESNKETQNTIKEQTDFLTSNTVSDENFVLPEDNTNDTTGVDDEINFIFDDIMNTFTDTSSNNSITLTFPFTNETFDISYASVYNGAFEKNNSMAYLKRIIQLGYWYIIAVFVVKDISNKVNKVKTGDIDKIQTGNIKEDLL